MKNHVDIINLWSSPRDLAEDIGERYETVRKWKYRKSIPSIHWFEVIQAAKKRKLPVTHESLAKSRKAA